jgi:hypothetical protein
MQQMGRTAGSLRIRPFTQTNKDPDMRTPTSMLSRLTLALALTAAGSAWAQTKTEDHSAHHPQATAAASASTPASAAGMEGMGGMGGMGGMHEMHDKHCKEMEKIHGIKNKAKRQKLMEQHMKDMHEHMEKMDAAKGASAPMGDKPMPGAAR